MGQTTSIFRTPVGGQTIPANTTVNLTANLPGRGGLVVKDYPGIRIFCGSRISSQSVVTLRVIFTEGRELIGYLVNIPIAPGEDYTNMLPIPGTTIAITAEAGDGPAYIDLIVYGYDPDAQDWCSQTQC